MSFREHFLRSSKTFHSSKLGRFWPFPKASSKVTHRAGLFSSLPSCNFHPDYHHLFFFNQKLSHQLKCCNSKQGFLSLIERTGKKKRLGFLIVLIAREMARVPFLDLPKSDINESLWDMSLLCREAQSSALFHSFPIKTPPSFLNTKYCYLLPFLQFGWFLKRISLILTGFPPQQLVFALKEHMDTVSLN